MFDLIVMNTQKVSKIFAKSPKVGGS